MLRKALYTLLMVVMLPAFASAYNCWSIAKVASPTSAVSGITTPDVAGKISTVGNTVYVQAATAALCSSAPQSVTFTVAGTSGSMSLKTVKIDNVLKTTPYTVAKGSVVNHSIVASYAVSNMTVTTVPAAGGYISPSVAVASGGTASISINPNAGYTLTALNDNYSGANHAVLASVAGGVYALTNVTVGHTITPTFTLSPAVTAAITNGNITLTTPIVTPLPVLDGSASTSNVSGISYLWEVTSGPVGGGATLGTSIASKTTFNATLPGTYGVKLTVSAPSATSQIASITIYVQTPQIAGVNTCLGCHSGRNPDTAAYKSTTHFAGLVICVDCHNPGNADAHPYQAVTQKTVSNVTFKALTTAGPAAKGQYFCWNATCHANRLASDLPRINASSHFRSPTANNNQCSSCHGTDLHNQDGEFDNKCGKCHTDTLAAGTSKHAAAITDFSCRSCHTGTAGYGYSTTPDYANGAFTRTSSASVSKHRPEMFKYATSAACTTCHAPLNTKFTASKHWVNSKEYGAEFANGAVTAEINPNESWVTTEFGGLTTCSTRCHFKPNLGPNPKAKDTNAVNRPGKDGCVACHDPHVLKATYSSTCLECHSGSKHGKVPNEFFASKHWKNTKEFGPEFAGGAVNGEIDANNSQTTTENGALTTCAFRCHFSPGSGPDKTKRSTGGIAYTDPQTGVVSNRPTGDACLACHDAHGLDATYKDTCLTCHSGSKHGVVPAEFFGSKHWKNNFEYGAEFANQPNTTVVGGSVVTNGTVNGIMNANDAYTTTENGGATTCAYRCHFRPGMGPQKDVAGYLAKGKSTTYVTYSSIAGKVSRPGGDACMACHNAHNLEATARSTCYTCHTGGNHGWSVKAFEKSSHNTGTYAILDGIGGPTGKACTACHNAHSTEATFFTMSGATGLVKKGAACQQCHTPGADYAIYDATGALKAPHGGGVATNSTGGNGTTQYVTQGAICADCHSHNNTINAGFAEGGHGAVSSDPLNAFGHYDWNLRTNNGTRQNGNCDRCHTAYGFMKFANQTTGMTRLQLKTGQANNVLICVGCHDNVDKGTLRTGAKPAGNPTALSGGYFALFSSASPTAAGKQGEVAADKTKIQISFPGYQNSSICIPCHSGRSTAQVFVAVIDQAKLVNKNYSTVGTSYYQHAANMGQTFISQGGYDFNGSLAVIQANGPSDHAAVKMTGSKQGPCVGCHYSKADGTHSLEVVPSAAGCVAAACHATVPDVAAAKANFDAGVAALDTLIRAKFAPLQTVAGDLAAERANVRFGRFGKAAGVAATDATAKAAYGAWYNWQLLTVYDKAAYAHNPRYARQILNDTIAFVANGTGTMPSGSTGRTLVANAITANSATPGAAALAKSFLTAPGCAACHAANVTAFAAPGVYHAETRKYACANCHTELHMNVAAATQPTCNCHGDVAGGAQPVLTAMKAVGATCNTCHASNNVHSMKAADLTKKCVDCHAIELQHTGGKVADSINGGVRAIVPEFTTKRSHHITGGAPTDAQCVICHLEGKSTAPGVVVVDTAYHMKDANTYLRDVDNAANVFVWDGADHTAMDNFCFNCHDANGANDLATIQAILPAATKTNPFADTLTNTYDMVARTGVVDVKTAFTTTNASHHAVSGQRYAYRFSTLVNATTWYNQDPTHRTMPTNADIAEFHVGEASPNGDVIEEFDAADPMVLGSKGEGDNTLFEAGKFVSTYTPLGASQTVADNSTLHCGDCHTVGQWTNHASTNADGSQTTVVIGAHGSANEYLLRNSLGTDALHSNMTYVCFNCHKTEIAPATVALWDSLVADGKIAASAVKPTWRAGWGALNPNVFAGQISGYATAHAVSGFHAQCQADSAQAVFGSGVKFGGMSSARIQASFRPQNDRVLDYLPATGATAAVPTAGSNAGAGNITGIACTSCHNSGLRSGFGGIHGGNNTYTDGLGRSQKTYRFMPGMGNYRYAPPGGWDGKDVSDTTLVTQTGAGVGAGKPMGGCYTNGAADLNVNGGVAYSSCSHHGTSTAQTTAGGQAAGFRKTYGGGTASTPTAAEPTVREATGGSSLVTRPLKY